MEFEIEGKIILINKLSLETDKQFHKRIKLIFEEEITNIEVLKERINNSIYLHYIMNNGCKYPENVEREHHILRKN